MPNEFPQLPVLAANVRILDDLADDVQQGFLVRTKAGTRTLDRQGFPGVTFRGEYPIGKVTYAEEDFPVRVNLEAFSPFIPLNAADSALPTTLLGITLRNPTDRPVGVEVLAWLENAVCFDNASAIRAERRTRIVEDGDRNVKGFGETTIYKLPPQLETPGQRELPSYMM